MPTEIAIAIKEAERAIRNGTDETPPPLEARHVSAHLAQFGLGSACADFGRGPG